VKANLFHRAARHALGHVDVHERNGHGRTEVRDLVGEVANTISGNARRDFGRNFVISTPTICDRNNAATAAATTGRSFVIPINWRSYAANVVVCLQ